MADIDDYNAKLPVITAIAEKDLKSPSMPVKVYLHEAEFLHEWAQDDKEALTKAKLDWDLVMDIPARAGALRHADAVWYQKRFSQVQAEKEWDANSEEGYELRNILLHDFRHAYDGDDSLLARVSGIADGYGHADMIHDLSQLAVLGRAHNEPLVAIGFDQAKLDKANAFSDALASLLAKAEVDKATSIRTLVIRDQAYTHLKEAVDAVRKKGQYVFWRNATRVTGYASDYHRRGASKTNKPSTDSGQTDSGDLN
jgi:hypothetical protein